MTRALVIALACLLAAPALASAGTPLPVGEADGVKIDRRDGAIRVTLSKKLHKRLAGKLVGIDCTELPDPDELGLVGTSSGGSRYRVPTRRRTIGTGDLTRGIDFCRVRRPRQRRLNRRLIASVPLTQRGAVHLDETQKSAVMLALLTIAGDYGKTVYPTPTDFLARRGRGPGPRPRHIVAIAQPSDTPAAGDYGYYSDGARHAAVVTVSAAGRRLFIEVSADDTLYTNVAGVLGG